MKKTRATFGEATSQLPCPSLSSWPSQKKFLMNSKTDRAQPVALALLRVVAGFLLWQHGVQKLFGWFSGQPVPAYGLFWSAGVIETVLSSLLVMGLLTQAVALILCGEMALAFFTQHLPKGFWPIENQGIPAVQFCVIFLLLWTAGPGKFSLDGLLARHSAPKQSWFTQQSSRFYPWALTLLRIATAFLVCQFGVRKMFGWLAGHKARFLCRQWFAGVAEIFSSPLIAIGAFTQLLAFLLAFEMATAFWVAHVVSGVSTWPIENKGEPNVLFCFSCLFLMTAGPGRLSLDNLFARYLRRRPASEPLN
jgi:putative oxidoreductase